MYNKTYSAKANGVKELVHFCLTNFPMQWHTARWFARNTRGYSLRTIGIFVAHKKTFESQGESHQYAEKRVTHTRSWVLSRTATIYTESQTHRVEKASCNDFAHISHSFTKILFSPFFVGSLPKYTQQQQ